MIVHCSLIDTKEPDIYLTPMFQPAEQIQQHSAPHIPDFHGSESYYKHQEYKKSVLQTCGIFLCHNGTHVYMTQEDYHLIDRICKDNQHYNAAILSTILAQSSIINNAHQFFKNNNALDCFRSDIFIDPIHFKDTTDKDLRIENMMDAVEKVVHNRHKQEKTQLESIQKQQMKVAKKKSKIEENHVALRHKKELKYLSAKQNEEKKHPLRVKKVQQPDLKSPQIPVIFNDQTSNSQVEIVTKEEIIQQYQKLREQHQASEVLYYKNSSYQQVMDKRLQAFESSLKNQKTTIEQVQITSQTRGFLQAHGIDPVQFQKIEGVPIQHHLTRELVEILDAVADSALHHQYAMYQKNLIQHCADLASLSQQSNHQGVLQQAIEGTNCCHGIKHYLNGIASEALHAYQEFQSALHYLQPTLQEYALIIEQDAIQGIAIVSALEAIVAAGMVIAPTATVAATGIMIGATAYVMAPLCAQAALNTLSFGQSCITGNWDKVAQNFDTFTKFLSAPETVARLAECAGGAAVSTPHISSVIDGVLSLRPVITSVHNEAGQMMSQFYIMTKDNVRNVFQQSIELLQLPEFVNFTCAYKNIIGCNFFTLFPDSEPILIAAFQGMDNSFLTSIDHAIISQLFSKSESVVVSNLVKTGLSQGVAGYITEFLATDVGKKMYELAQQDYEVKRLNRIAKEYNKIVENRAPQEVVDTFLKCYELSIIPTKISAQLDNLHTIFKDKYLGLPEFSSENKYLTMQVKHIFYPSIESVINPDAQSIKKITLNGFHHDEYNALEKAGLFRYKNKEYGTEECFKATLDFENGITSEGKTFFPSNWSREKTAEVIFEASQNRIEEIIINNPSQRKFECLGPNNLIIEIMFNKQNLIVSAYPSMKNFKKY